MNLADLLSLKTLPATGRDRQARTAPAEDPIPTTKAEVVQEIRMPDALKQLHPRGGSIGFQTGAFIIAAPTGMEDNSLISLL